MPIGGKIMAILSQLENMEGLSPLPKENNKTEKAILRRHSELNNSAWVILKCEWA
jgi:hypothetical protein